VDVEATQAYRKSEVSAARTMIDRTEARFGLKPNRLLGDGAYGSAEFLGWMVDDKKIAPHVTLLGCVYLSRRQGTPAVLAQVQNPAQRYHQRQETPLPI